MAELRQDIRFCTSSEGVRIAYATMGQGPALVWGPHFLTHLEFDLKSPVWRPWLAELSRHNTFIRYDARGCGLSDRDVADLSSAAQIADLEAVVDAARLERFALFQDAVEAQSGARPERITNAFVSNTNEIYLIDDASYYVAVRRTIDDSLAHELTHYLQARYGRANLADWEEVEAVAIQNWFRAEHVQAKLVDAGR